MAESNKYTFDEWVDQVRPDPRNTDQLTLLQGYIGKSSESGHIRVYSDETLNNFVEVPEDAIIYAQQLSQTESSLGGSKLWLRSEVVITYGDPKLANRPKSTFLEGDLMQQYTTQYGGYDPTSNTGTFGDQPVGYMHSNGRNCTGLPIHCKGQYQYTVGRNCTTKCPEQYQYTAMHTCTNLPINCPAQNTAVHNCTTYYCLAQVTGRTQLIHCLPQGTNTTTYNMGGYYGTFNPYMI